MGCFFCLLLSFPIFKNEVNRYVSRRNTNHTRDVRTAISGSFTQGCPLRKPLSGACGPFRRPSFSRKPSSPPNRSPIPANSRFVRSTHVTHTLHRTASQVNQQVQLSFPSSLRYVYTTNFQVLFKLFFTARSLQVKNKQTKKNQHTVICWTHSVRLFRFL